MSNALTKSFKQEGELGVLHVSKKGRRKFGSKKSEEAKPVNTRTYTDNTSNEDKSRVFTGRIICRGAVPMKIDVKIAEEELTGGNISVAEEFMRLKSQNVLKLSPTCGRNIPVHLSWHSSRTIPGIFLKT